MKLILETILIFSYDITYYFITHNLLHDLLVLEHKYFTNLMRNCGFISKIRDFHEHKCANFTIKI